MKTFYAIKQKSTPDLDIRSAALKQTCERHEINYVELVATEMDSNCLPVLDKSALLYNIGRGFEAQTLESLLLNNQATTFYKTAPCLNNHISTNHWNIILEKKGVPLPLTIYNPTNDKSLLKKYVEVLNGFPIIIKVSGNSAGIGIIRIDSWETLISVTDYITNLNQHFVFKKYINSHSSIRVVVLGDEVIAGAEFFCDENEFRSNTGIGNKMQMPFVVNTTIEKTALDCVHALNFDFGAVDLVIDSDANHYVLEVNFPFGFVPKNPINEEWAKVPCKMIEFLLKKSDKQ